MSSLVANSKQQRAPSDSFVHFWFVVLAVGVQTPCGSHSLAHSQEEDGRTQSRIVRDWHIGSLLFVVVVLIRSRAARTVSSPTSQRFRIVVVICWSARCWCSVHLPLDPYTILYMATVRWRSKLKARNSSRLERRANNREMNLSLNREPIC